MLRSVTAIVLALALAGCSQETDEGPQGGESQSTDSVPDVLTSADLKLFLAIVRSHEGSVIPEFTPLDEDESLDFNAPAGELLESFRSQFRKLFDAERQGAIWQRDSGWEQALRGRRTSPQRFAALVREVSLAIMRVRLEARVDLDQLVAQARRELERAERVMNQIDSVPKDERTRESSSLRTRSVIQLGRSVALLEFAELIRDVAPESAKVVRRYSRELKPLLPESNEELVAELSELARGPNREVLPAGYEEAEPD